MLSKDLHDIARAAILWYALLTKTLVNLGFKINPCDFCVANAKIKVKQCTIMHCVDDAKVPHIGKAVVRQVRGALESKFAPMKVVIGKEYDFLG